MKFWRILWLSIKNSLTPRHRELLGIKQDCATIHSIISCETPPLYRDEWEFSLPATHVEESQHLEELTPTSQMSTVFQASVRQLAHFVRTGDLHKPSFHHDGFLTTGTFMHKETRLKQKESLLSQVWKWGRLMSMLLPSALPACRDSGLGELPRHLPRWMAKLASDFWPGRALGLQVLKPCYARDANLQAKCYTIGDLYTHRDHIGHHYNWWGYHGQESSL